MSRALGAFPQLGNYFFISIFDLYCYQPQFNERMHIVCCNRMFGSGLDPTHPDYFTQETSSLFQLLQIDPALSSTKQSSQHVTGP